MRRARIKAVATVPVRRKAAQDAEPAKPKEPEKASENEGEQATKPTAPELKSENLDANQQKDVSPLIKEITVDKPVIKQEIVVSQAVNNNNVVVSNKTQSNDNVSFVKEMKSTKTDSPLKIKSPLRTDSSSNKKTFQETRSPLKIKSPIRTDTSFFGNKTPEKAEVLQEIKAQQLKPTEKTEKLQKVESNKKIEKSQKLETNEIAEKSQKSKSNKNIENSQKLESNKNIENSQKLESNKNIENSQKLESNEKIEKLQKLESLVNNEVSQSTRLPLNDQVPERKSPARTESPHRMKSPAAVEASVRERKSSVSSSEGSPMKPVTNRPCFMKPSPRLDRGNRVSRNSLQGSIQGSVQGSGASASESEDDINKRGSVAPRIRRRMIVSESARKLAEARREFLIKHENKTPDKTKLTMYDLIYYNPTTNPMKPKPVNQRSATRKLSVCSTISEKSQDNEKTLDEPSEMPVPQVKVGPNGQLIIDEQSLVIDQYKAQENIDRSDIIVDEDTNGTGFYKRRQKSKEWNKWETLKFYKALHTYGTDFLLMQSVFPKRTREELKLKYKKEEKMNYTLVEKALKYQEFDIDALQKDLASVEENEKKETEEKKGKKRSTDAVKCKKRKTRCLRIRDEINDNPENSKSDKNEDDDQSSDEGVRITVTNTRKRKRRRTKLEKKYMDEDFSVEVSDSEPEVYQAVPTRSGRTSKRPKKALKPVEHFDGKDIEKLGEAKKISRRKQNLKKENKAQKKENKAQKKENKVQKKENKSKIVINDIEDQENESSKNGISNGADEEHVVKSSINSPLEINDSHDKKRTPIILKRSINKNATNKNTINKKTANELKNTSKPSSEVANVEKSNKDVASTDMLNEISDDIVNLKNLKPGSLIILKKDNNDESKKDTVQVYVVRNDYDASKPHCKDNLLPIDMSPEILQTVNNCIKNIDSKKSS